VFYKEATLQAINGVINYIVLQQIDYRAQKRSFDTMTVVYNLAGGGDGFWTPVQPISKSGCSSLEPAMH
jgi:hypothetical protein